MAYKNRQERVEVRLNAAEVAKLDELRMGRTRSATIRDLIRGASGATSGSEPTHGEVLRVLAAMARDGKVAAAVALERAPRDRDDSPLDDELDRILRGES